MEKAKVQLREAKKGVTGTLLFENGKSMPIPKHFGLPLSENNKEAEVERNEKGQLTKIVIEGRVYRENQRAQSTRAHDVTSSHQRFPKRVPRQGPEEHSKEAHAPYNFVPLNESIVPAERNEIPPFDRYSTDLLSGYLEIDIDVKTPLYVRRKARDARFFEINGEPIIPGSSIRGMIRTLLEIASYSRMIFVDDSRYYFRSFADKCIPLRQLYNDTIGTETEGKVEAGFLRYESKTQDFYIVKAESPDRFADTQREFDYAFEDNSWKVWTGRLGKKKKKNWIFQAPDDDTEEALTEEDRILLTQEDVEDYQNDRTRRIPVDLLESAKIGTLVKDGKPQKPEFRQGVPCFFARYTDSSGGKRIAFGHTRFFRLPYQASVKDRVVQNEPEGEIKKDLAEAIFGEISKNASRVFFEDARVVSSNNDILLDKIIPEILSSPKPTCIQHYLEQPLKARYDPSKLKHWDTRDAKIRGYKLYWHRDPRVSSAEKATPERESEIMDNPKHQNTVIQPVKQGTVFRSRIRYENLSSVELGALLFVLDLPKDCCHKLGMGKPLGFGSIRITPKLLEIDRVQRYKSLFLGDSWQLGVQEASNKRIDELKSSFEAHVIGHLRETAESLWKLDRIGHLKKLLTWKDPSDDGWLEKTRYMRIQPQNEYKNRPVLPFPNEIMTDD